MRRGRMGLLLRVDKGSFILEALAATVVISVGILGLAALTGGLIRGNRNSDRTGTAALAAADQIESLLAGAPLNATTDLAPGPHPADQGGAPRYQGLDASGAVQAASIAAGNRRYAFLRRWEVTSEASPRCLRRVRVSVRDADGIVEIAAAETLVNCP